MSDLPFAPDLSVKPEIEGFFDEATNTISYIVKDPSSDACAIIDSVMDIDYAAGRITYDHADRLTARIREQGLRVEWLIEPHAKLAMPRLILPSLQVNMRAGEVPTDESGRPMLKVPLNGL